MTKADGPLIALWGDSFAGHYFNAMRDLAARSNLRLATFGKAACPPVFGLRVRERPQCQPFNDAVIQHIRRLKPEIVLLSANWINYEKRRALISNDVTEHMHRTIKALRETGAKVLVIGPSPVFPSDVPLIAMADTGPARDGVYYARYSKVFDELFRNVANRPGIDFVPVHEFFCDASTVCRFRDTDNYFFRDSGHMTPAGAKFVISRVAGPLKALLDAQ